MNYAEMSVEELQARQNEIAAEIDALNTVEEVNERSAEFDAIKNELEARAAAEAKKAEIRNAVAKGAGVVTEIIEERKEKTMEVEIRNTPEYIEAYANYIKTGKDAECRSLLSTNATDGDITGYVPVPDLVDSTIRTAWERSDLMSLVRKTNLKGNVRVGFELSADGANWHTEGTDAPDEEEITLGVVTIIPTAIKKWITISDEAIELSGPEFINYIYSELTYRILQLAEDTIVGMITDASDTPSTTEVSANFVQAEPGVGTVALAESYVIGRDLTLVMNRRTWAAFKAAQYANNYYVDPFEGRRVVFNNTLPAYDEAGDGDPYMIVGDFGEGVQANFPNGEQLTIKTDNLSLAEMDLVKFVGRMFIGLGLVADRRFTVVAKPESVDP